jgi:hypothetical protein
MAIKHICLTGPFSGGSLSAAGEWLDLEDIFMRNGNIPSDYFPGIFQKSSS